MRRRNEKRELLQRQLAGLDEKARAMLAEIVGRLPRNAPGNLAVLADRYGLTARAKTARPLHESACGRRTAPRAVYA